MSAREELHKAFTEKMVQGATETPAPTTPEPTPATGQAGEVTPPAEAGKEAVSGDGKAGEEKLPFDQHPKWKSARETEKKVQDLMEANDLENFDELVEILQTGKALKGKVADLKQLDAALEDAKTLARYRKHWEEQARKRQFENETPEQRAQRLEEENARLNQAMQSRASKEEEVEEAEKAIQGFTKIVNDYVGSRQIPEKAQPFVKLLMGIDNPFTTVDITDKKAVKKMGEDLFKKYQEMEQVIISEYIAKKKEAPPITPTTPAVKTETRGKDFKLKDARKLLMDQAVDVFRSGLAPKK